MRTMRLGYYIKGLKSYYIFGGVKKRAFGEAVHLVIRTVSTWPGLKPPPTSNLELEFEAILNFSPSLKVG